MRWRISIYNRSNLSFQNRGKMISVQVRPQCLKNILYNPGVRGGLPLFQCCSLDLVPSTTWLQNRELDDFLVIPNIIFQQPYFQNSVRLWKICLFTVDTHFHAELIDQNLTAQMMGSHRGATGDRIQISEMWLPECTREIAITGYLFRVMYIFFSTSPVLKLVNS